MIKLKGCPRCQGDLYLNQDMYGKYLNCLQCGYTRDATGQPDLAVREAAAATATGEKKAA
jgi:DNA-directed RNA polymerase subunit M/transcription elongation factor TFIIS